MAQKRIVPDQEKYEVPGFFRLKKLRQDKRVIVFLICLAISTFMWLLNALSKDYETTVVYPVKYVNLPDKKYLANDLPASFEMIIQAHGFTLLKNKLNLKMEPIVLDVERIVASTETNDKSTYRVRTASLTNRILAQMPDEIAIQEIRPESFVLVLDNLRSKLVKVKPELKVGFAPQFNVSSEVRVSPEYVTIYGPASLLDTIETIYTLPYKSDRIKKPVDAVVGLAFSEKITPSPKEVRIIIPVEEFTEKKLAIPVTVTEKPANAAIKLFPSEVQVSFRVGLSKYAGISPGDFSITIPFSGLKDGVANIPVTLSKKPEFINEVKITPKAVEFLIEK